MKKQYTNPVIDIAEFTIENIITASGTGSTTLPSAHEAAQGWLNGKGVTNIADFKK